MNQSTINQSTSSAPPTPAQPDSICYLTREASVHPLDLALQNQLAQWTGGISPASVILAWLDWGLHLSFAPGKQMELQRSWQQQMAEWPLFLGQALQNGVPQSETGDDKRYTHPGWSTWPYNAFAKSFLQTQSWWDSATTGVRGVQSHHENVVSFMARQWLDILSPVNYPALNPEVLEVARNTQGGSLQHGMQHWMHDVAEAVQQKLQADAKVKDLPYQPGRDVALTQGSVVFRNHLIELIHYQPLSPNTYAEPVLIVPSWIMKYYILDLSPHNSMVRYLLEQGHQVFVISWKNPDAADRDLGMNDYLESGLFAALQQVSEITQHAAIHATGYCLGGTLLAIGAAALAKQQTDDNASAIPRLASVSLLAAQTDFSEPGELGLFIDESQLAMLDALMWKQGYLDGQQMGASFQLLNSRDLIWSRIMRHYMLGEEESANDLMSWNADATRMPYRMHSEYLQHLFLHNDLAQGRYQYQGQALHLQDIQVPLYVVGTRKDHVSPWKSVFKIHQLTDTPVDFILASGGHNAGIVSEPGHAHRSYQLGTSSVPGAIKPDAESWLNTAVTVQGSWWEHWHLWLAKNSSSAKIVARQPDTVASLGAAPGSYVMMR
ncbi:PHA/PHB synthase family protein [Undibacterium rugosum]|uniref:PHA/PHB synthase family protein n=1 Tax=Undibacterium rugosum TaxID=2762291 RepID=UPI001B83BDFB|nr:alpha/beta fold hydrolase [Undibacterium rugosum]MBR7776964.1 polyhydroxyalkanoic acid synthase [Undibacterium rugosum]